MLQLTRWYIVCIQDDVLRSIDARKHVVLILLDLSAAFDTINHEILLTVLHRIGVQGDAHRRIESYLTGRTQCVSVNDHLSCVMRPKHGVAQGSVLGPLLFSVYLAGLSDVFSKHGFRYHAVFGLGVFSMARRHVLVSLRHALIWCAMLPSPSAMLPFIFLFFLFLLGLLLTSIIM